MWELWNPLIHHLLFSSLKDSLPLFWVGGQNQQPGRRPLHGRGEWLWLQGPCETSGEIVMLRKGDRDKERGGGRKGDRETERRIVPRKGWGERRETRRRRCKTRRRPRECGEEK